MCVLPRQSHRARALRKGNIKQRATAINRSEHDPFVIKYNRDGFFPHLRRQQPAIP